MSIQICSTLLLILTCSCNKEEKPKAKVEKTSQEREKNEEATAWKNLSKERIQAVKEKDYSRAITLMQEFSDRYPQSKYRAQTDEYIKYLETRQAAVLKRELRINEQKVTSIMNKLKSDAQPFINTQDYAAALELFENYNGELQEETAQKRLEQISIIKSYIPVKHETVSKAEEKVESESEIDSILSEVTENIIVGKSLDALKKHGTENKDKVPELAKILTNLTKVKSTIKEYFLSKKGEVIELTINGEPAKLKVVDASSSDLTVIRKLGTHIVTTKVSYKDLTLEDQVKSIASLGKETAAVYALYKSAKANDTDALIKYSQQTQLFASYCEKHLAALIQKNQPTQPQETVAEKVSKPLIENKNRVDINKLKLQAVVKKQKKKAYNGDYDDKVQNMEFYLKLENRNRTAAVEGYKTHLVIFAKSVTDSKLYSVAAKITENVSVDSLGEFRTPVGQLELKYDDNRSAQYGAKYHSYMAFIEDQDGKTVLILGKTSLFKKYHKEIAELPVQTNFTINASRGVQAQGVNEYSSASY